MYTYSGIVMRVVDADTIDINVDLGFYTHQHLRFRLARIDAWEVRGEERSLGLAAKERVAELLPVGSKVTLTSEKTGKYGRWIADILLEDQGTTLSDLLVKEGHAEYQEY